MNQLLMKIEKRFVDKKTGQIFFQFQLGPFKKTMATTVGVALRRVMIGSSKTVAITSAHGDLFNGNSLREDVFEFSLNLQQVIIKSTVFPFLGTAKLQKKGPAIVTAGDISLPDGLSLVNPYQYLCTLNEGYNLNLALVLSSPARTRFESGVPLKLSSTSLNQNTRLDDNLSVQDLRHSINKTKKKDLIDREKDQKLINVLTKDSPQSLPLDSILVDPVYTPIQSCSFEVINVVGSYFNEYMELTKSGLNQTPEYLRMSITTNGSIEPVLAVKDAVQELYGALSIFFPLSQVFSNYYNAISSCEVQRPKPIELGKIKTHYYEEICKKLDLVNLNLSLKTEIILRRNGITTLGNIIETPIIELKRIGLKDKEFTELKTKLSKFGFWQTVHKKDWEKV
jgi:DNA-directed RNA polymerase alpha subunit